MVGRPQLGVKTETDGVGYEQIRHMCPSECGRKPVSERAYAALFVSVRARERARDADDCADMRLHVSTKILVYIYMH